MVLRWATFAAIANSSTTVVVHSSTYYHYNPWYRKVLFEGEEGYVLTSAPVDWETDTLPDGAETIEFEGTTYYYADWSFFKEASGGGYVVVEPPVGAEVSAIPEEAVAHDEGDVPLYQFDRLFFSKTTNDAGREVYLVEPAPPEEELGGGRDGLRLRLRLRMRRLGRGLFRPLRGGLAKCDDEDRGLAEQIRQPVAARRGSPHRMHGGRREFETRGEALDVLLGRGEQ